MNIPLTISKGIKENAFCVIHDDYNIFFSEMYSAMFNT